GAERVGILDDERVEAATHHEVELLEQHLADRPKLLRIPEPLAQDPRVRIGASVAELRKLERDDVEMREVIRDRFRRLIAAELDPERLAARDQRVAMRLPLLERDDHRPVGNLGRTGRVRERIVEELAVLDQPAHAAASSTLP